MLWLFGWPYCFSGVTDLGGTDVLSVTDCRSDGALAPELTEVRQTAGEFIQIGIGATDGVVASVGNVF